MIEINNLTKFYLDEKKLKKIIKKVLIGKFKKNDLSIAFVNSGIIKNLNKKYRKNNQATDILSFPRFKKTEKQFKVKKTGKSVNLGEIIICPKEVQKNAKRFKSEFEDELYRVLIHGILHLLGYDHEKSENQAKLMEKKQDYYFQKIINK
ncbi:MAG: rRNA maturation RNase YbeY [Candidatus Nealsonbacteria bacterium]|nr:rRNA maturation RNase YbeY [Candidatus Nealsonbacteria bacterium]